MKRRPVPGIQSVRFGNRVIAMTDAEVRKFVKQVEKRRKRKWYNMQGGNG